MYSELKFSAMNFTISSGRGVVGVLREEVSVEWLRKMGRGGRQNCNRSTQACGVFDEIDIPTTII